MLKPRTRPARGEIDEAALGLARRHGAQILATARRYAATPEDAEDAYQRGLEILLTKAPTTREEELVPWLKTVVKHEAFALRRQRERHSPVTDDGHLSDRPTPPAITHDQAERLETLSQGAEALARLKPHEIRALVLKAEGYSYREICELTGWSYTKVNRLLDRGPTGLPAPRRGDPGRRRVRPARAAAVGAGGRRGERGAARPAAAAHAHVPRLPRRAQGVPRRCRRRSPRWCRPAGSSGDGRVRGFVEAALANLQQKADSALGAVQHKTAALGERAHAAVELAAGQKIAAVAASAAALAGGGTAVDHFANHGGRAAGAAATAAAGGCHARQGGDGDRDLTGADRPRSGTGAHGARSRRAGARGRATAGPARARPTSSAAARSGQRVHADQPCGRRRAGARRRGRAGGTGRPDRRRRRRK